MTSDIYTENLADFGARERKMLAEILAQPLPQGFDDSGVKAAMNSNSGNVFLVNSDYQCAMMNGDKIELFHSLPYGGAEGFLSDLVEEYKPDDLNTDDVEYIKNAAENEGFTLPASWQDEDESEEESAA